VGGRLAVGWSERDTAGLREGDKEGVSEAEAQGELEAVPLAARGERDPDAEAVA
jgi:hypothetical protein